MKTHLRLVALAAAIFVSGCSTINTKTYPDQLPATAEKAQKAMEVAAGWDAAPVITEGTASIVITTPFSVPESMRARKVQLGLEPGATINDVVAALGNMGIPILIADQEAAGKAFFLPRFNGTVGQLLGAISRATDVWFTWNDGAILVSGTERIAVSVPQDNTFAEVLVKGLNDIGVKEHAVTWQAGMAAMQVTPSQYRKVRQYLARITNNSAFITLNVAVVNVTLNQNAKQGIDWEKLQISALTGGNQLDVQAWQKALGTTTSATGSTSLTTGTSTTTTGTTTTTTGTTSTTGSTDAQGSIANSVASASFAGGALQGLVFGKRFNFSGMFNFLQTYGDAETKQNVLLKTVAGNKVEFKSLTQIPYVKEIGVTTTSGTGNSSALGSTQTEKADDGITVEMTPTYDAAANTVSVDMKLSIKAVIAFNQLSAGNQLGTLTQPTTAERSFNDILRMRPGQTTVVGGLAYDSVTNSYGSPLFLQGTKAESQTLKLDRQSMFIVVRSNVVRIGQVVDESSSAAADEAYLDFAAPAEDKQLKPASKTVKAAKASKVTPVAAEPVEKEKATAHPVVVETK